MTTLKIKAIATLCFTLTAASGWSTETTRPATQANAQFAIPVAPTYVAPELLKNNITPPTPPTLPTSPMAPQPLNLLPPPIKRVELPFPNLITTQLSRAEIENTWAQFTKSLPEYGKTDYYANGNWNLKIDVVSGEATINPNYTYNSKVHKALILKGNTRAPSSEGARHLVSKSYADKMEQLLDGTPVVIDGKEYTAIIYQGHMFSTEGQFRVDAGNHIFSSASTSIDDIPLNNSRDVWVIDSNSPGYKAYQQHVEDNEASIQAYISEMEKYSKAQEQYAVDSAEYQTAFSEYQIAQTAYMQAASAINAENASRISAAQQAYQTALANYQTSVNKSLENGINAIATMQGVAGGQATGTDSLAVGDGSIASGDRSTAVGNRSFAAGDDSVALGNNAVALNDNAVAIGGSALAIGGVAIGQGATSESNLSVAIGTGARAVSSVAIGTGSQATDLNTTAVGDFAAASGARAVAIGVNASATGANSVALGANTVAARDNSVSVGGRQVTDVAAPRAGTDAANKDYVDQAVASVAAPDLSGLENRLGNKIKRVEERADAGTAIALAMTPPITMAPGESAVGAGFGAFGSQQAMAVTFAHNLDLSGQPKAWYKEAQFSAGIGVATTGRAGVRAGMAFKW